MKYKFSIIQCILVVFMTTFVLGLDSLTFGENSFIRQVMEGEHGTLMGLTFAAVLIVAMFKEKDE